MARGQPVTDADRARIRVLHAQGLGRNAIAREVGISPAAVTYACAAMNLTFARTAVAAANEARVVDLKARRLALVDRAYSRAEFLYRRLEAPKFKALTKDFGGGESAETLDFVPTQNERDLAQAITTHLGAAAKLELQDADQGVSDAKSLLADLGKALGIGVVEPAEPVDN